MKNIGDWIMLAGVLLIPSALRGWQLDMDMPADPPAWRWAGVGLLALLAGHRLSQWLEIGEWRMWWQIPRAERPEYYRRLEEARRHKAH